MTSNHEMSTYNISKYSRQISQSNTDAHNTSNGGEWEHRSGSGLHLLLERTLMDDGSPNGLVLRVIQDSSAAFKLTSRSNILEEVNITALQSVRLNSTPSLKVVYQETRVGFRYLCRNDEPKKSIFRRFQVTFTSLSDASVLIGIIQGCCICTPARGGVSQKPASMAPPPVVPTTVYSPLASSSAINQQDESMIQGYQKSLENTLSHPSVSPSIQQTAVIGSDSGLALARAPSAQPLQSYHNFSLVNSVYPLESQMLLPSTTETQTSQLPFQTSSVAFQSTPNGSEPSSTSSALHPVRWSDSHGPSSTPPVVPPSDPIRPTLVSVAKLYQLPVEELESTVADILREPGFEEFIGKLDKMWGLHGFLRR